MSTAIANLARNAERQFGVFTRTQARQAGFTDDQIDHRLATRSWVPIHRGVFRIAGTPLTHNAELMAAVLRGGPGTLISHGSAAASVWTFEGCQRDGTIHVTVLPNRRLRSSVIRAHTSPVLDATRTKTGIPVTTPVRTILDIAPDLHIVRLEVVLDDALRRNLVRAEPLRDTVLQWLSRRRCYRDLLAMLEDRIGTPATGSGRETVFRALLRDAGLPLPIAQHSVFNERGSLVARVDFAYPELCIAIEIDSAAWHSGRRRIEHDSRRQNRLVELGWTVLRFSPRMIEDSPAQVIATTANAIGVARAHALPVHRHSSGTPSTPLTAEPGD